MAFQIKIHMNKRNIEKLESELRQRLTNKSRKVFRSHGMKTAVGIAVASLTKKHEGGGKYAGITSIQDTEMWRWINDKGRQGGIAQLGLENPYSSEILLDAFKKSCRGTAKVKGSTKKRTIGTINIQAFKTQTLRQYTAYEQFAFSFAEKLAGRSLIDFIDGAVVGAKYKWYDTGLVSLVFGHAPHKSRTYFARRVFGFLPYMNPKQGTWSVLSSNPEVANWREEVFTPSNRKIIKNGIIEYVKSKLIKEYRKK